MKRGVALVNALIFSILVGVFVVALYGILTRLTKTTEELRTFSTVKEAASSGARYGASLTNFPTEWEQGRCAEFNLEFRIAGRGELGRTQVFVCRVGSIQIAGQEISGASYEPTSGSEGGAVFKIVSISSFPANAPTQTARVEAVYVR